MAIICARFPKGSKAQSIHLRKWLGAVMGKKGEDFARHDKWLRPFLFPLLALRFPSEGQSAFAYRGERKSLLSLRDFSSAPFGFRLSPSKMFL